MKKLFNLIILISTCVTYSGPVSIGSVDWTEQELKDSLQEFAELYKKRPIKDNKGGMRAPHMFYTWFMIKRLQPKFIIESGVWKGQSTWLFEQAAPDAYIISIDPNLAVRKYISPRVRYERKDFSKIDWSFLDPEQTVCFFDDHYGVDRVKQCHARGFKHILYEDNYATPEGTQFHPTPKKTLSLKATLSADNNDTLFMHNVSDIYYEFPPVIPNRTNKLFHYENFKEITAQPLYDTAIEDYLKVYEEEAFGYVWYAYVKLK